MLITFGVVDYIVFALTLLLSAGIGVYFGCFGSKQKSTSEYLYGNGQMKAVPVGLSLYSSAVSAVTIIGTPSEVYQFGTQFLFVSLGSVLSLIITWIFVLPVFCKDLGIKMPYEYFELRFDSRVRTMSSLIYIIHVVLYMPICLYSSTVALSELTELPLLICTTLVGGVCVLYTMIGGFKSVIWTDTLQATLMMASCFVVMIMGIKKVGGFDEMWSIAKEGQRIILFDMNPDPFARLTFWSASIGMGFIFASHSGCSASTLQRYMSLPGEKEGRISSFIGAFGFSILTIITGFMGLSMYALYHDCDPLQQPTNGVKSNQLVPRFISDTIGGFPGFPGFFIAGLLSAGLSTLSAEFNTVAGLIYHDFIKKLYRKPISDATGAKIMKLCVLIVGVLCLVTVPIINSKNIFQFGLMLGGLTYGAKLGILLLGTTFPTANALGALWGTAVSVVLSAVLSFGAMYYKVNKPYELPLSTENCPSLNETIYTNFTVFYKNTTASPTNPEEFEEPFFLLKLSFMYYTIFGMLVAIIIGLLVSHFTKNSNKHEKIDPKLIVPFMQKYIPNHKTNDQNGTVLQKMLSKEKEDFV